MKTKTLLAIFFTFSITFFSFVTMVRAQTTGDSSVNVNISNSTGGNSVSTSNDSSTHVVTESNSTSNSHVRVEQNGKVTEFNSTGEDIDYTSDDGSVKVKINGESNTSTTSTPVPVSDDDAEEVLGDKDERVVEEHKPNPKTTASMNMNEMEENAKPNNAFFNLLLTAPNPMSTPLEVISLLGIIYSALN